MALKNSNVRENWSKLRWENWPLSIKYILLSPVWIWYCLRSRAIWFFTPSNPTLTFGGFEGEPKREMYEQLPSGIYPRTFYISPSQDFAEVSTYFSSGALSFPVGAKPDVGMGGLMFRKISSMDDLKKYHLSMKADYILQAFVNYPTEVSVFYYRYPGKQKGRVTGMVRKEGLAVKGDGKRTLLDLMQKDPAVKKRLKELSVKHRERLGEVIPENIDFILSDALNLSRGGRLISLEYEIDERLTNVFDKIADHASHFYYGRFDVKCLSLEDLKNGRNFSILEFNGAGADPHHVYGGQKTFLQALSTILMHWRVLFEISNQNSNSGIKPWPFIKGLKHMWWSHWHFKSLTRLDAEFSLSNNAKATARKYREIEVLHSTSGDTSLA